MVFFVMNEYSMKYHGKDKKSYTFVVLLNMQPWANKCHPSISSN